MSFWTVFGAAFAAYALGAVVFGVAYAAFHRWYLKRRAKLLKVRAQEFLTAARAQQLGEEPLLEQHIREQAEHDAACHGHDPETTGLLSCPFCGNKEQTVARSDPRPGGSPRTEFAVFCYSCGASGPMRAHPEAASDAWNRAARQPEEV